MIKTEISSNSIEKKQKIKNNTPLVSRSVILLLSLYKRKQIKPLLYEI